MDVQVSRKNLPINKKKILRVQPVEMSISRQMQNNKSPFADTASDAPTPKTAGDNRGNKGYIPSQRFRAHSMIPWLNFARGCHTAAIYCYGE